jgi:hypothetical protein
LVVTGSKVVEHTTHLLEIEGLNPATGIGRKREIMVKKWKKVLQIVINILIIKRHGQEIEQ